MNRKHIRGAIVGSLVLIAAGLALWLSPLSTAFDQVNDKPAPLGLVTLTEGQTLRVSIAHVIGLQGSPVPDRVCSLQVGFVDAQNRSYGIPDTFELRPGMARSFDFRATGDGSVRPVAVDLDPKEACPAVLSLEVLGINGIIVYDSQAFTDPWLSK